MKKLWERAWAPALLTALFWLGFREYFTSGASTALFPDAVHLIQPLFNYADGCLRNGDSPLWMRTVFGGLPLYDTTQFSFLYPFYFLSRGWFAGPTAAATTAHWLGLFHVAILYLNTYIMLRVLRLRRLSSILGAFIHAACTNTTDYAYSLTSTAAHAWLPLAVTGVVLIVDGERRWLGTLVAAAAAALCGLATTSHELIQMLFVSGWLVLWRLGFLWRAGLLKRTSAHLALTALVGFSLAAPILCAVLDMPLMIRWVEHGPIIGSQAIPYADFLTGQWRIGDLAATLLPFHVPTIMGHPFIGSGAALLGVCVIDRRQRHWVVVPLLVLAAYSLAAGTGSHLGLARLNYALPLINRIREPTRFFSLFALCAAVLAAFGFERLRDRGGIDGRRLAAILGVTVLFTLATLVHRGWDGAWTRSSCVWLFVITAALLIVQPTLPRRARRVGSGLILAAVVAAVLQPRQPLPRLRDRATSDLFSLANQESHAALSELAKIPDIRDYRCLFPTKDSLSSQFWSMNGSFYGLRSFETYMNPLPFQQWTEVFDFYYLHNYYPLLGAKYALCDHCQGAFLSQYRLTGSIGRFHLYVADNPAPRHWLVYHVAGTYRDNGEFLNHIHEGFDYMHGAYLPESTAAPIARWLAATSAQAQGKVAERHVTNNSVTVEVATAEPALLVFNEFAGREWRVLVDGAAEMPQRVNLNQLGVLVPPGTHRVVWRYRPIAFEALQWLQRLSIVLVLLAVVVGVRRRGRDLVTAPATPNPDGEPEGPSPAGRFARRAAVTLRPWVSRMRVSPSALRAVVVATLSVTVVGVLRLYDFRYFLLDDFHNVHRAQLISYRSLAYHIVNVWSDYLWPVGILIYRVLWDLFGAAPLAFHCVELGAHAINVGLLYLLLRDVTGRRYAAAAGALLFSFQAVFAGIFYAFPSIFDATGCLWFLGLTLIHLRCGERVVGALVNTGLLCLALQTKQSAAVFPLVWLLYDLTHSRTDRLIPRYLPVAVLLATLVTTRVKLFPHHSSADVYYINLSFSGFSRGAAWYLNSLFEPVLHSDAGGALWLLGGAVSLCLALWRRAYTTVFFLGAMVVLFLPVICMDNHRAAYLWYVPFFGVAGLFAGAVAAAETWVAARLAPGHAAALGGLLFCLAGVTNFTAQMWAGRLERVWAADLAAEYRAFFTQLRRLDPPPAGEPVFYRSVPRFFDEITVRAATEDAFGRHDLEVHIVGEYPPTARYRLGFDRPRLLRE